MCCVSNDKRKFEKLREMVRCDGTLKTTDTQNIIIIVTHRYRLDGSFYFVWLP